MRFQVLTWGVIAFIKGDNAPSKWWVGPQDRSLGNKPFSRAEAAALLYVARKTVGAVDVTLDCKGVPQTVARTQGWKIRGSLSRNSGASRTRPDHMG